MGVMEPAQAPRGLRALICLLQTSVLEAEHRPSIPTRLPVRSRSRPPPCEQVSETIVKLLTNAGWRNSRANLDFIIWRYQS